MKKKINNPRSLTISSVKEKMFRSQQCSIPKPDEIEFHISHPIWRALYGWILTSPSFVLKHVGRIFQGYETYLKYCNRIK